ncbi:MAG: hypothetical protein EZS28_000854 [Streblomastix strix]|uniref:Uncharacterized protein n=1 Tax=Streblomastix strix TaxID=222440 RepID=A0A5J4X955_9EUKA|nr:MAG: hypothetical protein EZS28_000854 [Streblomastix strix]
MPRYLKRNWLRHVRPQLRAGFDVIVFLFRMQAEYDGLGGTKPRRMVGIKKPDDRCGVWRTLLTGGLFTSGSTIYPSKTCEKDKFCIIDLVHQTKVDCPCLMKGDLRAGDIRPSYCKSKTELTINCICELQSSYPQSSCDRDKLCIVDLIHQSISNCLCLQFNDQKSESVCKQTVNEPTYPNPTDLIILDPTEKEPKTEQEQEQGSGSKQDEEDESKKKESSSSNMIWIIFLVIGILAVAAVILILFLVFRLRNKKKSNPKETKKQIIRYKRQIKLFRKKSIRY